MRGESHGSDRPRVDVHHLHLIGVRVWIEKVVGVGVNIGDVRGDNYLLVALSDKRPNGELRRRDVAKIGREASH